MSDPEYPRNAELDKYLKDCVAVCPEAIQEEFVRLPADLAFWNQKYAEALREFLMAKIELDITKARLQPIVRESLKTAGAKVTEALVESAIDSHDACIEARRVLAIAEVSKNELFGNLDAIRAKRDMLMSLGAHLRVEMENDPVIREQVGSRKHLRGND